MIGADYSVGRPGGAALAASGVQAVGRYVAAGRGDINITAGEVADLRAHGIDIFTYNEHEASYMLGGAARAATVAPGALAVARAAGLPDGPIFYSIDFDATLGGTPTSATALGNMRKLADFLTGAAAATSWDLVGVYGGYYTIGWLLDNLPALRHAVQTSAWSAGRWDPRAFCRQDGYGWKINGVDCDHLTIMNPDEGSLRYRKGDDSMSAADVDALKAYIDAKLAPLPVAVAQQVHRQQVFAAKKPDGTPLTIGDILLGESLEHPLTSVQAQAIVNSGVQASLVAQVPAMTQAVVSGLKDELPSTVSVDYDRIGARIASELDQHIGTLRIVSDAPAPAASAAGGEEADPPAQGRG